MVGPASWLVGWGQRGCSTLVGGHAELECAAAASRVAGGLEWRQMP